jgi:predicted metal-dependent peptidase
MPDETMLIDVHDFFDGDGEGEVLKKIGGALSEEDKKKIREIIRQQNKDKDKGGFRAGTEALGEWLSVGRTLVRPKQKWETIIKRWMRKYLPNDFDTYEHWARVNRRLVMIPDDALLPTEMELQDKEEEGKILVYFYLDTSGSCVELAPRFWKAANSLPKRRFDVRLFCFDTQIYPVTPEMQKKGKIRGGGGTVSRSLKRAFSVRSRKTRPRGRHPNTPRPFL